MNVQKTLLALGLLLGLSACAGTEPATRSAMMENLTIASQGGPMPQTLPEGGALLAPKYEVTGFKIIVPRTLKVSEANTFKPRADIVWHGDPAGDRYQQVGDILTAAATRATTGMGEGRSVTLEIALTKFHGVTEKTRYTIGGMHEMRFDLTVRDAATGEVLDGPRQIVADVRAAGGERALAEEAAGFTQKVVVTNRLTEVLRRELSAPVTDPMLVARAQAQALEPLIITR